MYYSPFLARSVKKGKRMHTRNYSSKVSSESELELFREAKRAIVEAEARVGDAAWA
jgi:hypothetical protein